VYDYPESDKFINGLKNLKLSISFSGTLDETSNLVDYVCPDNHYLESWNDAEPKKGFYSLAQPTINKLFNTRASQESLLKWTNLDGNFYNYIKKYWEKNLYPLQKKYIDSQITFKDFWNKSLQDGVFELPPLATAKKQFKFNKINIQDSIYTIARQKKSPFGDIEIQLTESIAIGNGKHANNPWLQELPNPISKVCWDNYASIAPINASDYKLENGDILIIKSRNHILELPMLIQPGQAKDTISIALGYGRLHAGKVGNNIGKNAFKLAQITNGNIQYHCNENTIAKSQKKHLFALTQTHHSMEGRDIVRETTLTNYLKNISSDDDLHKNYYDQPKSIYKKYPNDGYQWGLSVDLNACTGCATCVIACQAENNVPVIGKDEVRKRRIMHWIRIDRYYSGSTENPTVYHQPVMCQHCDNAPCENVCPVEATTHSNDGLNHMTYNRCIGTRYCINNCPYKVRRFNWYRYTNDAKYNTYMTSEMGRMVLNPDVVVRSIGVVEKCSLCVQRIQEGIGKAKLENRMLVDNDIKPACVQTCPADALVFGNMNDKTSLLSKKLSDKRNYYLLEELSVLPSVGYLTRVRNNSKSVN